MEAVADLSSLEDWIATKRRSVSDVTFGRSNQNSHFSMLAMCSAVQA